MHMVCDFCGREYILFIAEEDDVIASVCVGCMMAHADKILSIAARFRMKVRRAGRKISQAVPDVTSDEPEIFVLKDV